MHKANGRVSRWAQKEAAKHTTPDSIRQRIAHEEKQIRVIESTSLTGHMAQALEAHRELLQVLTKRLADFA
jgi:hypothetical protein